MFLDRRIRIWCYVVLATNGWKTVKIEERVSIKNVVFEGHRKHFYDAFVKIF